MATTIEEKHELHIPAAAQDAEALENEAQDTTRVMFLITSMPVGGAETLLVNLVRRLGQRFKPQICCLKELGPLGEELANDIPIHSHLLRSKWDLFVLPRLRRLLKREKIDAVITVGAGDKMFWGRLAARLARVPVVLSALHSTGWPDGVGRLNRMLTPITDGFIAVAEDHGKFLCEFERFPQGKVFVIPNGIDVDRFQSDDAARTTIRRELKIADDAPLCGIVAALRPEKNHRLFLQTAALVHRQLPAAHFAIVGDGPLRPELESLANELQLGDHVHFLGNRSDIPQVLSAMDLFALTSDNEANPVSILEAMATELPVVATDVGSVSQSVEHGATGYLCQPGDAEAASQHWLQLLRNSTEAEEMGLAGRAKVMQYGSLDVMVRGYEDLISETLQRKRG